MIKKVLSHLLSYLPTALPVGMTEFNNWSDSILAMSKVPDNDSTRFAVAVMIMHLNATEDRKAKRYFVRALNKSAANECANSVAVALKEKQRAAQVLEAQKKAEATGIANGSNNKGNSHDVVAQVEKLQEPAS